MKNENLIQKTGYRFLVESINIRKRNISVQNRPDRSQR